MELRAILTINEADLPQPVMPSLPEYPKTLADFGAVGDGVTDDTDALQRYFDDCGERGVTAWIENGVYMTRKINFRNKMRLRICGAGTLIAMAPRWAGGILTFTNCHDCIVRGIKFDTNAASLEPVTLADFGTPYCTAIKIESGSTNIKIKDCTFYDLYMNHIHSHNVSDLRISNCTFTALKTNKYQCDFVLHTTGTRRLVISDNRFEVVSATTAADNAGGLLLSGHAGGRVSIKDNLFANVGRDNTGSHRVGVIDLYSNMHNVMIEGNVARNCHHLFTRIAGSSNVTMRDNYADTNNSSYNDTGFVQINTSTWYGCRNVSVVDNTFHSNQANPTTGYCFNVSSTNWKDMLENVTIRDNRTQGWRTGVSLTGSFKNLKITDNDIETTAAGIMWGSNGVQGDIIDVILARADVSRNTIAAPGAGIGFPLFAGKATGRFSFNCNEITTSGVGINCNNVEHEMRGNTLNGCSIGLYPRGRIIYRQSQNVFNGCVKDVLDTGAQAG